MNEHLSHPDIIKRLNRVQGQIKSIISMLESQRPCIDIAQQMQAVESAIASAKKLLVHDHIDHCLKHAVQQSNTTHPTTINADETIREFKAITKYL